MIQVLELRHVVGIALGILVLLKGALHAQEFSELDQRMSLEGALYALEVKGDPEESLDLLEPVLSSDMRDREIYLKSLLLEIRCFLQLGRMPRALSSYRRLHELAADESAWIDAANRWVPDSFITREVPWQNQSFSVYSLDRADSDGDFHEGYLLGYIEKNPGASDDPEWRIRAWQVGEDYSEFEVRLEADSLQVRATQLGHFPFYPFERKWLGLEVYPSAEAIETGFSKTMPIGWFVRGLMMQQCRFELGFERKMDLYNLESGLNEDSALSVGALELLAFQNLERQPCWMVDVDYGDNSRWELFAFSSEHSKRFVEYRSRSIHAKLQLKGTHELDEVAGTKWLRYSLHDSSTLSQSSPSKVFLGGVQGVRCYMGENLKCDLEFCKTVEIDNPEFEDSRIHVFRIESVYNGEWMGWKLQEAESGRNLVVFGPEKLWNEQLVQALQPYVELLKSGDKTDP